MGDAALNQPTLGANDAWIDAKLVGAALPRRQPGAHKWGVGGLIIVAGAPGYAGAAILASTAAARAGAGIILLASSRAVGAAVGQHLPEAVTIALPDSETAGSRQLSERLGDRTEKANAFVIGPGLGDDDAAAAVMRALVGGAAAGRNRIGFGLSPNAAAGSDAGLLATAGKPAVIDADGLNWLAQQPDWPSLLPPHQVILTPHLGEFSRLRGIDEAAILVDPVGVARAAAKDWQQVVLLKSAWAVATDGDRAYVAADSVPALASAGTGDVLAGTVGAFLAQGVEPLLAAALAIYAGNRAAMTIAAEVGTLGLLASDLPRAIAVELGKLERSEESGNE